MGTRRLRLAVGAGIGVFAVIALASLASGTLPAVWAVVGAIPPGIVVGFLFFLTFPAFDRRR
jgi:hypothetical protein